MLFLCVFVEHVAAISVLVWSHYIALFGQTTF